MDTPGSPHMALPCRGAYAYVVEENYGPSGYGLRVIDITNPAAPVEWGAYYASSYAQGVAVAGSYAYLADNGSGLRVINITNPYQPVQTGFYDTGGIGYGVAVAGSYAYESAGSGGLRVIDIPNPAVPSRVHTPGNSIGVAMAVSTRMWRSLRSAGV